MEEDEKLSLKKSVVGSLSFGIKKGNKFYILFICGSVICLIICLLPIIIFFPEGALKKNDFEGLMCLSVMFAVALLFVLYFFIRELIFQRAVERYLNNANICRRLADICVTDREGVGVFSFLRVKIKVVVPYKSKHIILESKRYDKQFNTFIGGKVEVLFLPDNNEVLFLKRK